MKKALLTLAILSAFLLTGAIIVAAYSWDHIIAGGLSGTTGVALKVESNGTLYLTN